VEAKAMRAADDEIKALAENVIVVASYWLNYEHLRARASEANDTEKHLTRGVYQVMALVAPFLIGEAREHLDYLKASYLE
jgi:hypothetical protein